MAMHRSPGSVFAFAILLLHPLALCAQEAPLKLDSNLPYQAERLTPVTYDVDFSVVVTPPSKTKVLKVWLPLPQTDGAQEVLASELTSFPMSVEPRIDRESVFGNKFAYFEFANPQGAQILRHQFTAKVYELRWNLDSGKIAAVERWPAAFDAFRRSESQAVLVDDRFRQLLDRIVPQPKNPLLNLSAVMNWTNENFTYSHGDVARAASSVRALDVRDGNCSDYHSFCAAMGRALGYPTCVTYGLHLFPKNSPTHCKLEAYLPPVGWVSFDVSETQKMIAAIRADKSLSADEKTRLARAAGDRLNRGFRDNTWLLLTRGTEYDLAPPASKKVVVARTAYIEADGVALPDPDPADASRREFAWMTAHKYQPDRPVSYPFQDFKSLEQR